MGWILSLKPILRSGVPGAIHLAALAVMVLAAVSAAQHPDFGALVLENGGQWVVSSVESDSLAARAGLRVGDVLVALDGLPPGSRRITDPGLDLRADQTWTVLRRDGTREGETITLRPAGTQGTTRDAGIPEGFLIIALSFWAVGGFVRFRKPDDGLATQFSHLSLAVAVALALSTAAGRDVLWAKVLEVIAFSLLPALFLGFAVQLGTGAAPAGPAALAARILLAAGILVGGLYLALGIVGSEHYETVRAVLLVLLAGSFLAGLAILVRACVRPRLPHTRQQVGVVLVGAVVAGVPLTVLSLIPESLGLDPLVRPQLAALTAVVLPISFGYAILRRRLLDMDVVVERTMVHGVMVLLVAGCYGLLVYVLSLTMHGAETEEGLFVMLLFLSAVTLTFVPVQSRIRRLVDQLIYRDRYDYARTLLTLGNELTSPHPIDDVLAAVADGLAEVMNLEGVVVFLRQSDGGLAPRAVCGRYGAPRQLADLASRAAAWQPGADSLGAPGHFEPLVAHGNESGLLYLGPKRSNTKLRPEDLSLASTIASQTAIAIANSLLVERLQAKVTELELLGDRLLHVQEDERKRLARDLHDGALHTVMELVRQAENIAESLPAERAPTADVEERLAVLVERGRDAAHELRMVCTDLYPSELSHLGLVAALESLTRRISRDEDLRAYLTTKSFPVDHRLPEDLEDPLYHVAREALENACRHASATEAEVTLGLEDGRVTLAIRDDGCGFSVPRSAGTLLRTGHLGLASMRERVERLGGQLKVISAPGRGTVISASVPTPKRAPSRGVTPQAVAR